MFRIVSNYTEIGVADTLKEAKEIAVDESYRFDDVVTIEKGPFVSYMASHGALYSLRRTK